jgi:DNA-binding transcriptional regulator YiaG
MFRPFCLEQVAHTLGGVHTMMHLAWLSSDARVRDVALRWRAHSEDEDCLLIERLCVDCGIHAGDFVAAVANTAWDLDPGLVDALLGGIEGAYWRFEDSLNRLLDRVPTDRNPTEMPLCREQWIYVRRLDEPCDQVVELRRRWRLSQTQLAFLLMVSGRSVELWESRKVRPGKRQWCFLMLLERYAEAHGISALRRRFVRQPPRYAKRGRPTVTSRCAPSEACI